MQIYLGQPPVAKIRVKNGGGGSPGENKAIQQQWEGGSFCKSLSSLDLCFGIKYKPKTYNLLKDSLEN